MTTSRNRHATSSLPSADAGTLGKPVFRFPTTLAQQSFWYLDRLEPGNPCWNIAVRFRLCGPLNLTALHNSINEIVRRHEVLRTTFELVEGVPGQIVHSDAQITLTIDDLTGLSPDERDLEEERLTITDAALRFDLKTGPLIRTRLLKLREDEHVLLLTVHHIVSDGWSIGIFSDELASHYQDFVADRPPQAKRLPLQFADYAVWKNEQDRNSWAAKQRAYWQEKLANLPNCEIPPDFPRAANQQRGYILSTLLPVPLTSALIAWSRAQGCTFYITCLAALKVLIAHYTRQADIHVGTLVAGRERAELELLIGLFINTLIMRTDLSGDPEFPELLRRVQSTVETGLAHQDVPFQQVIESLRLKRDRARPTIYSINFIYQRDFVKPLQFAGLTLTPIPSKSPGAIYDLNFFMVERADGWRLSCEYNYDLYAAASVNRMLVQLRCLLEQIAQNPARRISEFSVPESVDTPLPPFVPQPAHASASTKAKTARQPSTNNFTVFKFKKIFSRVYTDFGKKK